VKAPTTSITWLTSQPDQAYAQHFDRAAQAIVEGKGYNAEDGNARELNQAFIAARGDWNRFVPKLIARVSEVSGGEAKLEEISPSKAQHRTLSPARYFHFTYQTEKGPVTEEVVLTSKGVVSYSPKKNH
jgi:hypothetical protein